MGKVSRRLNIIVLPPCDTWPEIEKLEEQGHNILRINDNPFTLSNSTVFADADLILGSKCWYFDTKHRKYLTLAIKQARLKRYGKPTKKDQDVEPTAATIATLVRDATEPRE